MSYNSLFGLGTHSQDASLQAWYKLTDNAASTVVVNHKTGGTNGALTNAGNTSASSVSGPGGLFANALSLDGSNDYVNLPGLNSILSTGSSSYLIRCKPTSHDGDQNIFSNSGNAGAYGFQIGCTAINAAADRFQFGLARTDSAAAIITSNAVFLGATNTAWYSLASVFELGGNWDRYINGTLDKTSDLSGWAQQYNQTAYGQVKIGNRGQYFASLGFGGHVSDAVVFSRALSAAEVTEWTNGPEPLNLTSPVLNTDGTVTSGTWDAQNNGAISRTTYLHLASDDSLVATLSTLDPDFSSYVTAGLTYYVIERGINTGDYDSAEDTASADTTIAGGGGGPGVGYGTVNAIALLAGVGLAEKSGQGAINAAASIVGHGNAIHAGFDSITAIAGMAGVGLAPTVPIASGQGTINAIGALLGVGESIRSGLGQIDAVATMVGVGVAPTIDVASGYGEINAICSMIGSGTANKTGSSVVGAVASITGSGKAISGGYGVIDAIGVLVSNGKAFHAGLGDIDSVGIISGVGETSKTGQSVIEAIASIVGVGLSPLLSGTGQGTVNAVANLLSVGTTTKNGEGEINAVASMSPVGMTINSGESLVNAVGSIIGVGLTPVVDGASGQGAISGVGGIIGQGKSIRSGQSIVNSIALIIAQGYQHPRGDGDISGVVTIVGAGVSSEQSILSGYYYYGLAN